MLLQLVERQRDVRRNGIAQQMKVVVTKIDDPPAIRPDQIRLADVPFVGDVPVEAPRARRHLVNLQARHDVLQVTQRLPHAPRPSGCGRSETARSPIDKCAHAGPDRPPAAESTERQCPLRRAQRCAKRSLQHQLGHAIDHFAAPHLDIQQLPQEHHVVLTHGAGGDDRVVFGR